MDTAPEIAEAEANPYLYQKIENRLSTHGKNSSGVFKYKMQWVAAFFLVVALNASSFVIYASKMKKHRDVSAIEALKGEIITSNTYSY